MHQIFNVQTYQKSTSTLGDRSLSQLHSINEHGHGDSVRNSKRAGAGTHMGCYLK
jgi:hypothetical protein